MTVNDFMESVDNSFEAISISHLYMDILDSISRFNIVAELH